MKLLRTILLITHIMVLFLLLGIFMNAYVPPKIFPWFNLLSLGFPVLMILYLFLSVFWVASWKKRAIVFILVGMIFLNPVKRWINYNSDPKENFDIKIVSLNVKAGSKGISHIEEYINSLDADIVLLQEYSRKEFQFEKLNNTKSDAINAIFTRYKIIDQKELIKSDFETNNAYASQTDIEIKGKTYRFINVYLQPFKFEKSMVRLNSSNEENEQKLKDVVKRLIPTFKKHQEQVKAVRKGIDSSPYPVILAGDLNSVPNSYEYYQLSEGLKDAFVEVGKGSATSFHDYKFPLRIDYIFASESIQPVSYKVDRSVGLSDHYPVIATFKIKN
ncbi:endonuclease/exonuclease/phosphatase (EEP) superfamily protein YafD [Chryseobacterium defluvii]|uniref:Endonuclease/exonuclease/phosphatase (EEP) superfamily protein YafD n=1 Tax=Chryseobacterium defluvii TaxID=160396 RepID=A0A840KIN6_9FLAO|nr:endonuclease/exonuclease/phosphatase family protein [Chryseobacterium defluvii]MBB4807353.1 endonuclease/exonuclease/phosphatase (EEP) superfamily protein YafD [Chryseobacterium defluvii]